MKTPIAIGLLGLVTCVPWAVAEDAAPAKLEFEKFTFNPIGRPAVEAEQATLVVPERHDADNGRTIELPVLRFPTRADEPKAPVVYLVGGPGGSGLMTARTSRFALFDALRDVADVVTFDQRGTGRAKPKPACSARLDLPLDEPLDQREALEAIMDECRKCAGRLRDEGFDLSAYTTVQSAHDLDRLRAALGAEKISLWGTSYGTHLALAYTRLYPERVERLMLFGIEGPDHTLKLPSDQERQLEKLAAWVADDPDASRAIPDFVALVAEVLKRVEREPVVAQYKAAGSSKEQPIVIGKWDLQVLTANAIGRTHSARTIPWTYYAMSRGDFSPVASSVRSLRKLGLPSPMSLVMDCASGATAGRLARIKREARECLLGDAVNFPYPEVAAAWNAPDLGDEFRAPVHSDVPALFVSGSLDGRTPPSNAEEVLRGFPNGLHLIIENAGHHEDLFSKSEGMRRRVVAFAAGRPISTDPITIERLRLYWPARK